MDQENDKNPIAEIFDEMFTLLEAMETRSVATLDYLQGQQGVTDENLAPYLARASAASEVRWRAARARMEHLLAPKPKSSTEAAKDAKGKDENAKPASGTPKAQGEKGQTKTESPDSKDLGKELASAQPVSEKSADEKATKPQNAPQKGKAAEAKPKDAEAQASALAGDNHSDPQKSDPAKTQSSESDAGESPKPQSSNEEKQTQKAAN